MSKGDSGRGITMYHGTTESSMSAMDPEHGLGVHFGTKEQAQSRLNKRGVSAAHENLFEVQIKPGKSANLPDLAFWNPQSVLSQLHKGKYITGTEKNRLWKQYKPESRMAHSNESEVNTKIVKLLQRKGYGSIKYKNEFEGKGYSYIIFSRKRIGKSRKIN